MPRRQDDIDQELRVSYDMLVDRYIARGMTPAQARRAARLEFEDIEPVKEGAAFAWMQDLRYACRGLLRRPSFAVVALVTLALGIGVNTAVFSVFYSVLLRPLPYDHPEQLALVLANFRESGAARAPVSGTILREIEQRNRSLSGVAATWVGTGTFTGDNPEQVRVAQVTPNFFDVLGVRAAHGRTFTKDEQSGGRPAIVLSDAFYRRRFGAVPAIGKGLPMSGGAVTLVGLLPHDFQLYFPPDLHVPADVQAFIPFPMDVARRPRTVYFLRVIARVKPGVSMAEAQRDLDRVAGEIRGAYTEFAAEDLRFTVSGMQSEAAADIRPALTALFAGAAFVLLICCVNVTSLLLARASERRREIALRAAIGASRARILRQLLAEGLVLGIAGGLGGLGVGWAGFRVLLAIRPERLARIGDAGLSWPAMAFAAAASLGCALIFGLAPTVECRRLNLTEALRAGGRGLLGRLHRRAGAALVIAEVALGFVLVIGAALAARTLSSIEHVRPGFDPRNLLTFQLSLGRGIAPGGPLAEVSAWEAKLAAMPAVERVGATSHLPLDDFPNWYGPYKPEGAAAARAATLSADVRSVTPGYLPALGARLIEGRYFDARDNAHAPQVIIIDELLAHTTWPGESAIGRTIESEHIGNDGFGPVPAVVVGVVEHVRNHSLTRQVRGEIYIPYEQSPRSPLTWVVRTRVDPLSMAAPIRVLLHERNPNAAMAKVRPMTEYVARDIAPAGFTALLAAVFGAMALLLAATGIYGVLNYQVSRRLPEMGIRMALGARARDVLALVMGEGGLLVGAGVLLGAAAALGMARWLGTLVYGVSPRDPLSFAAALLLLPAAGFLGCWRPARRAAGASPSEIIREE